MNPIYLPIYAFLPNKHENPNYIIHPRFQYMAWFWSLLISLQQPKYSRLENKHEGCLLENKSESYLCFLTNKQENPPNIIHPACQDMVLVIAPWIPQGKFSCLFWVVVNKLCCYYKIVSKHHQL